MNTIQLIIMAILFNLIMTLATTGGDYTTGVTTITTFINQTQAANSSTFTIKTQSENGGLQNTIVATIVSVAEGLLNVGLLLAHLISLIAWGMVNNFTQSATSTNPTEKMLYGAFGIVQLVINTALGLRLFDKVVTRKQD